SAANALGGAGARGGLLGGGGGVDADPSGTTHPPPPPGGITALDLLVRHPDRLRHVIAHEPPCVTLLPDGERLRAELIGQLGAGHRDSGEPTPFSVFLAHVLRPFSAYRPAAGLPRLTVAAGTDSRGQLLHEAAEFTAEHTGGAFIEVPGGHLGTLEHPVSFADRVTETLLATG
ncbi:alpha/beta fold hydrolase, partial [Streptomyces sp. NPDC059627]